MSHTIYIVSDLHTERMGSATWEQTVIDSISRPFQEDNRGQNILLLAGDIGDPLASSIRYNHVLSTASNAYDKVFVVSGNHEYYSTSAMHMMDSQITCIQAMTEVEEKIRDICSHYPNVSYLQKDVVEYEGIRFLGCTLWTSAFPWLSHYINDNRMIHGFNDRELQRLHDDHVTWLQDKLEKTSLPNVVVTHHLPTYRMISEKFSSSILNPLFASNSDWLMAHATLWACGHSHGKKQVKVRGCQCILNPLGYPIEKTGFDGPVAYSIPSCQEK